MSNKTPKPSQYHLSAFLTLKEKQFIFIIQFLFEVLPFQMMRINVFLSATFPGFGHVPHALLLPNALSNLHVLIFSPST